MGIEQNRSQPKLDKPTLDACIHCGLCLPACPTYLSSGKETESPRGRIYLVDKLVKGELELTERMQGHLESCLGCLGCQTACPSGVNYEKILDSVRPELAKKRDPAKRNLLRFVFSQVLTRYGLLKFMGALIRLWQLMFGRFFFAKIAKTNAPDATLTPLEKIVRQLASWEMFAPEVLPQVPLPKTVSPKLQSEESVHAQLFSGCVMDVFYNHVNHNTIRLLLKQGHSVSNPDQTCCGALAFHQGEEDIARSLAKANIEKFGFGQDPIVVTAAGCGAMLKNYDHLLSDDPEWSHKAKEFSKRVYDLSEILEKYRFQNKPKPLKEKTTYHAACHLSHAQNVREEPKALLNAVDSSKDNESQLIPLVEQENCCGSAGIYNLFNTEMALSVLDRKLDHIEKTGAKTVVTSNPGCQLQIEAGIRQRGLEVKVKHIAEILDESYTEETD